MRRYIALVGVLACAVSPIVSRAVASDRHESVSLIQLLATPEKFNGKLVRVFGFLRLTFEGDALYLHREDFVQGLNKNAVWVDRTEAISRDEKALDNKYVLIEGIFDAQDHGHMGLFGGAISKITRIRTWPSEPQG